MDKLLLLAFSGSFISIIGAFMNYDGIAFWGNFLWLSGILMIVSATLILITNKDANTRRDDE